MQRSTILRALGALLAVLVAVPALAADSTSVGLPDVPWQKPWARQADQATTAQSANNGVAGISGSELVLSNGQRFSLPSGGSSGGGGGCQTVCTFRHESGGCIQETTICF